MDSGVTDIIKYKMGESCDEFNFVYDSVQKFFNIRKTHTLKEFLHGLFQMYPDWKVLVISCKLTQNRACMSLYGTQYNFKSSGDADRTFDKPKMVAESKRNIFQYESIHHHYNPKTKAVNTYDLVILDEFRSTLAEAQVEQTNKEKLHTNAVVLQTLLRYAQRVLILDADAMIDNMIPDFLYSAFNGNLSSTRVYHYTHVALPRDITFSFQREFFMDNIQSCILQNKTFYSAHKSKKSLKSLK